MADRLNRKAYQQTLPGKRISAGCLLFDEAGRLLIVKPIYKEGWEIPGGTVLANESPLEGCIRETAEELGLARRPLRLLVVDYADETKDRTESLSFIFDGGVLSSAEVEAIRLPPKELSEYRFLPPEQAMALLNRRLARRVRRCLGARVSGTVLYLEEEKSPWASE
ncbi:MAG TPA: NUDIX hydrolase [Promineifilum sp.]|nr:NUDIX hydrolase [Promineifilum sp.]